MLSTYRNRVKQLTTYSMSINKASVLGMIQFISSQIDNSEFCRNRKNSHAKALMEVMEYPDNTVKEKAQSLISLFCQKGNQLGREPANDLRRMVYKLCLNNKYFKTVLFLSSDLSTSEYDSKRSNSQGNSSTSVASMNHDEHFMGSIGNIRDMTNERSFYSRRTIVSTDIAPEVSQPLDTSITDVVYRNSNAFFVESIQSDERRSIRRSNDVFNNDSDNDIDELLSEEEKGGSGIHDFSSEENSMFVNMEQIIYVMMTLYQCVPFICIIKKRYSNFYNQVLDCLGQLCSFVRVIMWLSIVK